MTTILETERLTLREMTAEDLACRAAWRDIPKYDLHEKENAMSLAQSLLPEFDHEMATTRKLLERAPEDDGTWQPHEKSMTFGKLAIHLATLPMWGVMTLTQTEFDMQPPGGSRFEMPVWTTRREMLSLFDKLVGDARAALAASSDADLMVTWSFKAGGATIFSMPRIAVWRSFVMNHSIHHRGQFSVYLRLRNIPVPAIYGPSADESN